MSRYRDTYGRPIRVGDIVAHAVTLNREHFAEGFTTRICRRCPRDNRRLILDGSMGWGYLADFEPGELAVITSDTDLRGMAADLIRWAHEQPVGEL